ncbi:selenocysteine-specific translation elongation factor [Bacillus sp. HMF5848]|uniref:selenocysteine-specific translation elongation factor n=1 Tax=Bacillus sp. HMF5848 TaxID=2495421 RepID=UPI000F78BD55|nr:selenocysteine-specific translation elongation factor [Bacillus sp. HMF5848]RSK27131.1 selenocysteine-specific translation elongation factor [Bacillus sp. HMF5848]
MNQNFFTLGLAGHIDHGKTSLTKALTGIDTDRLKEEKERSISIELGYAPFELGADMKVSIIDVPGHERFIRQMIAGVAGIDLVILAVAADEGVMPQTKEHVEILSFLGVKKGIVAITKIDRVESGFTDLVKEDIKDQLSGTIFENSPIALVDSIHNVGIDDFKSIVYEQLLETKPRNVDAAFRMPIDQVFSMKGQGTIVRGTIYDGKVQEGDVITVYPKGKQLRVKQIQVHRQAVPMAIAGQRAAINVAGVTKEEIHRGEVLTTEHAYTSHNVIDVALHVVNDLEHPIKQRMPIRFYTGTTEVSGQIVFFDRNIVEQTDGEILCQIRLQEDVIVKRGDRFVIRRPSPVETIAGGWIIDPNGERYRFGEETINSLRSKRDGTPQQRVRDILIVEKYLKIEELTKRANCSVDILKRMEIANELIVIQDSFCILHEQVASLKVTFTQEVQTYHTNYPMRPGIDKAQLLAQSHLPKVIGDLILSVLEEENKLLRKGPYIYTSSFQAHFPKQWAKRMESCVESVRRDQLQVAPFIEYISKAGIPTNVADDFVKFLIDSQILYMLTDKEYIHRDSLIESIRALKRETDNTFDIQAVKAVLNLSRKYVVPFLELLDKLDITVRKDNVRKWNKNASDVFN